MCDTSDAIATQEGAIERPRAEDYLYVVDKTVHVMRTKWASLRRRRHEDMMSDGYIGLILACEKFAPAPGVPFVPFAIRHIQGRIRDGAWDDSVITVPEWVSRSPKRGDTPDVAATREAGCRARWGVLGYDAGGRSPFWNHVVTDDHIEYDETKEDVHAAIANLTPSEADVIRRYYGIGYEPQSIKAISVEKSQCASKTIGPKYHGAMAKLRQRMTA